MKSKIIEMTRAKKINPELAQSRKEKMSLLINQIHRSRAKLSFLLSVLEAYDDDVVACENIEETLFGSLEELLEAEQEVKDVITVLALPTRRIFIEMVNILRPREELMALVDDDE